LGGGGKFAKALLHARFFWSFIRSPRWGSWVYSPSVTFGIGTNLVGGTGGELPLYERFFPGGVGGEGDVRGYQLYSLGPQVTVYDQIGEPVAVEQVGGSKELLFQNQIGFPLLSSLGLRGFVFLDAGQAYFLHESMPLTSLQAAWGLGIFWRSPFGPITLDIGIPINPRPNDMGESFDFGAGTL
jgi:outer membrane protein insertion porin family